MADKQADIKVGVITNYDDKGLKGAKNSLKNFTTAIADADGVGEKFKAGFASVATSVKANAGMVALGAGTALVAFGVKAVGAFTDVAKSAIDLSTSTGLAVEEASRWIGVADDYKVSAEALATGLGKVSKTLDDTKWAKYGIATHDASGEARSANDILLDSLDTLSKVDNATEQAKIGQELFGKGYQSLTPILGHTREEYEKMLGAVEAGQVITGKEAAKAEKMRLAEDALGDSVKELTLSFGGLLVKLTPLLNLLTKVIGFFATITSGAIDMAFGVDQGTESFKKFFDQVEPHTIKEIGDELDQMAAAADKSKGFFDRLLDSTTADRWDYINETIKKMGKESPEAIRAVYDQLMVLTQAANDGDPAAQKLVKDYEITTEHLNAMYDSYVAISPAISETERETRKLTASTHLAVVTDEDRQAAIDASTEALAAYKTMSGQWADSVKADVDQVQAEWDQLTGDINNDKTWLDLQTSFDELKPKIVDAWKAAADGAVDAEQKVRDAQVAVDDQKLAVIQYGKEVLGLPPEKLTNVLAMIDQGAFDAAEEALRILTRNRGVGIFTDVNIHSPKYGGAQAAGGRVQAGVAYTVGEKRPELFVPDSNGTILPRVPDGSGDGGPQPQGPPPIWAGAPRPVIVQVMMNDRVVQEILISSDRLKGSVS